MSTPADVGLLPRTYFRMPRVPFDFRAVALAIVGYLVYWGGGLLISQIGSSKDIPGAFLAWFVALFDGFPLIGGRSGYLAVYLDNVFGLDTGPGYTFWDHLVGGVWFFGVWSFFGLAIRRIVSLRIARDESLPLVGAVRFAARNWVSVLLAPLIVAAAIGLFAFCNFVAGAAISIPVVGSILAILLVPLVVLSTILMLLIGLGGLFGFPLIGAAAAWERNGSLDAISRAFSYVFARPLQYFLNYFLIFLFTVIILYVGNWAIYAMTKTLDAGIWSQDLSITVDAPPKTGAGEGASDWSRLDNDVRAKWDTYREKTGYTGAALPGGAGHREGRARPFAQHIDTVGHAPLVHKVSVFVLWLFINLIWVGVFGYALFWFLGASSSVYADLRADVDGTEEDTIHTDEDEPPLDGEGTPPPPSGEAPVAGGTLPPSSGPSGPSGTTGPVPFEIPPTAV